MRNKSEHIYCSEMWLKKINIFLEFWLPSFSTNSNWLQKVQTTTGGKTSTQKWKLAISKHKMCGCINVWTLRMCHSIHITHWVQQKMSGHKKTSANRYLSNVLKQFNHKQRKKHYIEQTLLPFSMLNSSENNIFPCLCCCRVSFTLSIR